MEGRKNNIKISKKVLKIFLIIIAAIVVIYVLNFIRNLIIIDKILDRQAELKNCTNYSFTSEYYINKEDETKNVIHTLYKDGVCKIIIDAYPDTVYWYNTDTEELIAYNEKELTADFSNCEYILGYEKPIANEKISLKEKLYMASISIIGYTKYNDRKCYNIYEGKYYDLCIDMENGIVLKNVNGKCFVEDKYYDSVAEIKDWKMNCLTDEDLACPNLTGYEITRSK